MRIIAWHRDNGQLYDPDDLEDGDPNVLYYRVADPVQLSFKHLLVQDGSLLEALLEAKQAVRVQNAQGDPWDGKD